MFDRLQALARPFLLAAAAAGVGAPTDAPAAAIDDDFIVAMRLYHEDRYAAAFGRLAELADSGHEESARIALLMLRHDKSLYRSRWSATREQVQHWLDLATRRQQVVIADGGD